MNCRTVQARTSRRNRSGNRAGRRPDHRHGSIRRRCGMTAARPPSMPDAPPVEHLRAATEGSMAPVQPVPPAKAPATALGTLRTGLPESRVVAVASCRSGTDVVPTRLTLRIAPASIGATGIGPPPTATGAIGAAVTGPTVTGGPGIRTALRGAAASGAAAIRTAAIRTAAIRTAGTRTRPTGTVARRTPGPGRALDRLLRPRRVRVLVRPARDHPARVRPPLPRQGRVRRGHVHRGWIRADARHAAGGRIANCRPVAGVAATCAGVPSSFRSWWC